MGQIPALSVQRVCLMQEPVAAQARLEMTQKAYLPATYYAPCGNPHQSPADVNTIATLACSKRPDQGGALCLFVARLIAEQRVLPVSCKYIHAPLGICLLETRRR